MPIHEALNAAREANLDLVEVGPNVQPPMCKIMDYGKYMYRKERQEKKTAKKKELERKTVRVGFKTGAHDLAIKAKQILGFLDEGRIVRVELTLRGREKGLADMGRQKLNQFIVSLNIPLAIQEEVKRSPYGWTTVIKKQ